MHDLLFLFGSHQDRIFRRAFELIRKYRKLPNPRNLERHPATVTGQADERNCVVVIQSSGEPISDW